MPLVEEKKIIDATSSEASRTTVDFVFTYFVPLLIITLHRLSVDSLKRHGIFSTFLGQSIKVFNTRSNLIIFVQSLTFCSNSNYESYCPRGLGINLEALKPNSVAVLV
jgi:hypothetical protein